MLRLNHRIGMQQCLFDTGAIFFYHPEVVRRKQ